MISDPCNCGKIEAVAGTPFDFRRPVAIGKKVKENNVQLTYGKGYDHNFVLNQSKLGGFNHAAMVSGDQSGIVMDIFTTEAGLKFYGGNFMQGKIRLRVAPTMISKRLFV